MFGLFWCPAKGGKATCFCSFERWTTGRRRRSFFQKAKNFNGFAGNKLVQWMHPSKEFSLGVAIEKQNFTLRVFDYFVNCSGVFLLND